MASTTKTSVVVDQAIGPADLRAASQSTVIDVKAEEKDKGGRR